jgi:predicted permease
LLETLRNNFNLGALAVTLAACVVLVLVVAFIARRKQGRPLRDRFALVGSGVALVLLMPALIAFTGYEVSPEVAWLLHQLEYVLFLSMAYLVWWAGNKLSHQVRTRKRKRAKAVAATSRPE